MKVAVIQMVSSRKVETSLQRAAELIRVARDANVSAIFLPENFAALGHPNIFEVAEREQEFEPIQTFLRDSADESNCWIFAGTLPLQIRPDGSDVAGRRVRAASLVFDAKGKAVARYDKVHMFDVTVEDDQRNYLESQTFEHGDRLAVVDSPLGKVGLTVCYDIRFSEMYLQLVKAGAELFAVPSAFTVPTGDAHFEVLMRARAIESFAFTIAACQGGSHDSGRETYGHSMVVNPWGEVIAEAGLGEDVLIVDIDLQQVYQARQKMPVLEQRRL